MNAKLKNITSTLPVMVWKNAGLQQPSARCHTEPRSLRVCFSPDPHMAEITTLLAQVKAHGTGLASAAIGTTSKFTIDFKDSEVSLATLFFFF